MQIANSSAETNKKELTNDENVPPQQEIEFDLDIDPLYRPLHYAPEYQLVTINKNRRAILIYLSIPPLLYCDM